ncbi:hypothetical protein AB0D62_37660 [Streptomyces massasporeus]
MAQLKIRDLHELLRQAPGDETFSRTVSASSTTAPLCTYPRPTPRTP